MRIGETSATEVRAEAVPSAPVRSHLGPAAAAPPAPIPSAGAPVAASIKLDTSARAVSDNVGRSLSSIADVSNMPEGLAAAARDVLAARGDSEDVQLCIKAAASYRDLVSPEQAEWIMRSLMIDHDFHNLDDVPGTPLHLRQALKLLERGGPPRARRALHALALAGLKLAGDEAVPEISKLDTRTLAHLEQFVQSPHPLTRTINEALVQRRLDGAPSVEAHLGPDARARFTASLESQTLPALHPSAGTNTPASELAARFITKGREILRNGDFAGARQALLESSPLSESDGIVLAVAFKNRMPDGFGRCRVLDNLVDILRLTTGEVFRICDTVRAREYDARPDFAGTLNRLQGAPQEPTFPLQPKDSYAADVVVAPLMGAEIFHEMGHAFECARPDVLRAAKAFRDGRAIGKPRTLNDLNVIRDLAGSDAEQKRLLDHIAKVDILPELGDTQALHHVFDDAGMAERIDAFAKTVNWAYARPYSATEMAMPVVGPPYMGKLSPKAGTTEVASLGLEALSSPATMKELMDACPDHLAFIIGALFEPRS